MQAYCRRSLVTHVTARRLCAQSSLHDDIRDNATAFGAILRKERSARILYEDSDFLAFRNIKPYARLAGLVIPKRRVPQDPAGLGAAHLTLIERLKEIGQMIVHKEHPEAARASDYWLKFHMPPHISVEHLHLHVIAPVSAIGDFRTIARFCDPRLACDVELVLARMREESTCT